MDVIIYHNPACSTSRNALGMIRNSGVEPHVIEYLKIPPTGAMLADLITRMGVSARSVMRKKEALYTELGLASAGINDEALLEAMVLNPILIERPIVVTPRGVRLCRPSELVLDLLPPQLDEFQNEDGEIVVDTEDTLVAP